MTKQTRPIRGVILSAILALGASLGAATASAATRNGSIGVAHVLDLYEVAGCGGAKTLVIVISDEDFELVSRNALTGSSRRVDIIGTGHSVTLGRVRDGHWVSGVETRTGEPVMLVNARNSRHL